MAPIGPDFQVNTYTAGGQSAPAVTALPEGGFLIVWESEGARDGDGLSIHGRRFDSAGQPVGDEFQVSTSSINNQEIAAVTATPDGSVLVAFRSNSSEILGQLYEADGAEFGAEAEFQSTIDSEPYSFPSIAFLNDGTFLLSYTQTRDANLYTARFDTDGSALGDRMLIKDRPDSLELGPSDLLSRDDDSYVVGWAGTTTSGVDADGFGVFLQALTEDGGNDGDEIAVNSYTAGAQHSPRLVERHGEIVVVWQDDAQDANGTGVYFRRFDGDLAPLGDEARLLDAFDGDYGAPDIASREDGTTLAVFEGPNGILASSLDSAGLVHSPSGFAVAEFGSPGQSEPRVAALVEGFVVCGLKTATAMAPAKASTLACSPPTVTETASPTPRTAARWMRIRARKIWAGTASETPATPARPSSTRAKKIRTSTAWATSATTAR